MIPRALSLLPLALAATPAARPPAPVPTQDVAADRARAERALREGDLRGARALLTDLIVAEDVTLARRLMAEARAIDGLSVLDEAIELRPRDPSLLYLRGRAAFQAASEGGASNPGFLYEDALEFFRRALDRGQGVEAWFDASRAARLVPQPELALELARTGAARLAELESPPPIDPPVQRTWAEAAFDVFRLRVQDGADSSEAFQETERELGNLLGRTPEDPWPREQLANLYEWVGDTPRALEQTRLALELAPERPALHERLLRLAASGEPLREAVATTERLCGLRPASPVVRRSRGIAEFYAALERFEAGDRDLDAFARAEASFAAARGLAPLDADFVRDCLGYEAVVRNAIGWCHYHAGRVSEAKVAFLSMEDLFEGGLRWGLGARLPNGMIGLDYVVQRLITRPEDLDSLDDMVEAAAITDYLFAYAPEDGDLANNAGFVNRDTATLFERAARIARSEARAASDPAERARWERTAAQDLARAQEGMEKSLAAYEVAATLLADNARVVNDAGLVIAYYLRDDPDRAERYFLRAIELGREQLAADDARAEGDPAKLGPDARFALNEAWGDAHQNMGILELTLRERPAEALRWFRESLAIGPPSREAIRPIAELCERMVAGQTGDWRSALDGMVWLHNPRR